MPRPTPFPIPTIRVCRDSGAFWQGWKTWEQRSESSHRAFRLHSIIITRTPSHTVPLNHCPVSAPIAVWPVWLACVFAFHIQSTQDAAHMIMSLRKPPPSLGA
ncbi:unnamed protein product [Periconia digitata]|uniref:Uncharacterized protein n=1 Tax=Periconia digitata TaxID=1303443 RepID=A0A9W4U003_9PLEO|nr:unnamed protein product [Periconia digitata]